MRFLLSAAMAFPILMAPAARADQNGALTVVDVTDVFVPVGYDDNDHITVVVDGYLPDTCYKLAHSDVHFVPEQQKYVIFQFARRYEGLCLQARVPFFAEAHLGVLPLGEFVIEAAGAPAGALTVKEAGSAGPDDYLYAPLEKARVESSDDGAPYAILDGRLTNSCMKFDEVKVIDSGKTIEVLPIMKMVDGPNCVAEEVPFSWRAALPVNTTGKRRLLHVRSLNGKSVNVVF